VYQSQTSKTIDRRRLAEFECTVNDGADDEHLSFGLGEHDAALLDCAKLLRHKSLKKSLNDMTAANI
jgi:hypothetical protein